jgi:hypothetical protein
MSLIGRLFGDGKGGGGAARSERLHADVRPPDPFGPALTETGVLRNTERERIARSQRRHAIYDTVRESMIAAGVLSASYKFKVLAADKTGTDFLIMVDLAQPLPGGAAQMTWIEGLMERMAAARHALDISGVYWRVNDHAVFTPPPPRPRTQLAPRPVRPAAAPTPLPAPGLTGYEDTEQTVPAEADLKNANLSTTQYGDLH